MLKKECMFDLDGTLLDSMHVWDDFASSYLKDKGIQPTKDLDHIFATMRMEEAIDYLHTHELSKLSKKMITQEIYERLCERYQSIPLKPGVKQCIEHLYQRGVRMGVLSANHPSVCDTALSAHGIRDCFVDIISCEELHLSKDDPACFLAACERMQMSTRHVIVIEDALHAIQGAKKAGLYVIAIKEQSQHKDEKEIKESADIYIETMNELEEIICGK